MKTISMKRGIGALLIATGMLLGGCSTILTGAPPTLDRQAKWAVLPFVNQTETPQAGLRAESIAESLLHAQGINNLKRYPSNLNTETLFEPMDRKQFDAALTWARSEGIKYALAGSVDEWRYKVGIDGEPAAGVALQAVDVASGKILWTASGGSTGWSRESLSGVAQKLIGKLIAPLVAAAR